MKSKDVGLRIRVEHELRDAFVEACRLQNKAADQSDIGLLTCFIGARDDLQ
jgi:hypothetical protein